MGGGRCIVSTTVRLHSSRKDDWKLQCVSVPYSRRRNRLNVDLSAGSIDPSGSVLQVRRVGRRRASGHAASSLFSEECSPIR